ncbi:hypothetical protein WDV06_13855 [Streptomyces racemochromogenes]|uniref:GNAT family N-acetyltransferase n=1 Tax=Streptomyces racemochromogenes TaxID=67353 RepID=A0ABW7PE37_9ACTN
MTDEPNAPALLRAAARNNAEWCAAVSRAGHFRRGLWCSPRRTPPLYPDAVTLAPSATAAEVLAGVDTATPGCSVKDSFASLDLAPDGFEVLFEAQWVHRPAGAAVAPAGGRLEWDEVEAPGELGRWEAAWSGGGRGGVFHSGLLREGIVFLAGRDGGRIEAGAVLSTGGGVVGVSNVFGGSGPDAEAARAFALGTASRHWPELPVVGYEHGADLDAAVRAGFSPLGPLRVWLRTS